MSAGYKFTPCPASVIENAFNKALFAAQEQILTDCNTYVKHLDGPLEDSSQHSVKGLTLTLSWDTPYALRQWYTGQPSAASKMYHPKASVQWAEKAAEEYADTTWHKILEKGMADNL